MADILLDNQSAPVTPASGQAVMYFDVNSKIQSAKDDLGRVQTMIQTLANASTGNQTGFAVQTYLAGSNILVPNNLLKAGVIYRAFFDMTKTNAGVGTPVVAVLFGTNGTVADTARLSFLFGVGTAVVDTGVFEVFAHFRSVGGGVLAVLTGMCMVNHHLAATGLTTTGASGTGIILVTSGGFDSTVANSIIGVSFNGSAAFVGTNTVVQSSLYFSGI